MISPELLSLDYTKATAQLIEFWRRLPRPEGHFCPRFADFSSAQVNGSLPEIFLSEWLTDEDLVIIQTGTVLDRLLGYDLTGLNIFERTEPSLREAEKAYYQALRVTPCAGKLTRSAPNEKGEHLIYRTLQLPLLDPYGNVRYFVGTGAVLTKDKQLIERGLLNLGKLELVERHFFDIGAGLPAQTHRQAQTGPSIFYHPGEI